MEPRKPMDIDGLIGYLREQKGMEISEEHRHDFMNMGYYHGYKGYRYIQSPQKKIPYTKFEELAAIYAFDSQLKALFYPCVMTIETALKNYVLEAVILQAHSENFTDIYNQLLTVGKGRPAAEEGKETSGDRRKRMDKNKDEIKRRLNLRNRIYKLQTDAFGNGNRIAEHFLGNDRNIPIWGIFELMSLGEFGYFVSCLNEPCRRMIAEKIGMNHKGDTQAMLPQRMIYAVKDLRNAIAHNDVVFDTRFRTSGIDRQVSAEIEQRTGIESVTFLTITDWLVLIVYLLMLLHVDEREIEETIARFENAAETLRNKIPMSVYSQIIYTDMRAKLTQLRKCLSLM